jgi:hypothetical protein
MDHPEDRRLIGYVAAAMFLSQPSAPMAANWR